MKIAGLVLAAGAGTRFGQPKAPVVIGGERLVDRSVRILTHAGCDPVVTVLGAWVGQVNECVVIENDQWFEGIGSSLRAGLRYLADQSTADAVMITLVDLPGLTQEAIQRVAQSEGELVVACYSGKRGHPVKMSRRIWGEAILTAQGNEGARRLLDSQPDLVLVEVGDIAAGDDMDYPA